MHYGYNSGHPDFDTAQCGRKDSRAPVFYAAESSTMSAASALSVVGVDLVLGHRMLKTRKQTFSFGYRQSKVSKGGSFE